MLLNNSPRSGRIGQARKPRWGYRLMVLNHHQAASVLAASVRQRGGQALRHGRRAVHACRPGGRDRPAARATRGGSRSVQRENGEAGKTQITQEDAKNAKGRVPMASAGAKRPPGEVPARAD